MSTTKMSTSSVASFVGGGSREVFLHHQMGEDWTKLWGVRDTSAIPFIVFRSSWRVDNMMLNHGENSRNLKSSVMKANVFSNKWLSITFIQHSHNSMLTTNITHDSLLYSYWLCKNIQVVKGVVNQIWIEHLWWNRVLTVQQCRLGHIVSCESC